MVFYFNLRFSESDCNQVKMLIFNQKGWYETHGKDYAKYSGVQPSDSFA